MTRPFTLSTSLAALVLSILSASLARSGDEKGAVVPALIIGKSAPDFELRDTNGKSLKLSAHTEKRGKNVLLVSLPANPATSRAELRRLAAQNTEYIRKNVEVLVLSSASAKKLTKLGKSLELPFRLLVDSEAVVATRFGLAPAKKSSSKIAAVLVDKGGIVRYIDRDYSSKDWKPPKKSKRPAARKGDYGALMAAVDRFKISKPKFEGLVFGRIRVNGVLFDDTDVIIDGGSLRARDKGPSRHLKSKYRHTPLTAAEDMPWHCEVLVIGIGMHGRLPVLDEIKKEAERRGVKLILLETPKAVEYIEKNFRPGMNVLLHVTC